MTYTTTYASPLGELTLAGGEAGLYGIWFAGQKYFAVGIADTAAENAELPAFAATRRWLDAYFAGRNPETSGLPLAPRGSDFRRAVWSALCKVPYGQLTTYGALAKKVAEQTGKANVAARAVGGAVGHNPISIIIPCHRVVGAGGSLTGYAGGLDRKRRLLSLEGVDIGRLYVPTVGTAL
jgi:methylated-DNA-[protein]-cysteine S-methyltransferase